MSVWFSTMAVPAQYFAVEVVEGGLRLSGELDAASVDLLASYLHPLPGEGDITIDLSGVTFVDATGLRELVSAHTRAEDVGRRVLMAAPSLEVAARFAIVGLTRYLNII